MLSASIDLTIEAEVNQQTWQVFAEVIDPDGTAGIASFWFNVVGSDGLLLTDDTKIEVSGFPVFASSGNFGLDVSASQDTISNGGQGNGVIEGVGIGERVLLASGIYSGSDGRLTVSEQTSAGNSGFVILSNTPQIGEPIETEFAGSVQSAFVDISTSMPVWEYSIETDLATKTWDVFGELRNPGIAGGLASFWFDVVGTGDVNVLDTTTIQVPGFPLLADAGSFGRDIQGSQDTIFNNGLGNNVVEGIGLAGPVLLASGSFSGNVGSLKVIDGGNTANPGVVLLRGPLESGELIDTMFASSVLGDAVEFAIGTPIIQLSGSQGVEVDGADQRFHWNVSRANPEQVEVRVRRNGISVLTSQGLSGSIDFNSFGLGDYELTVTASDDLGQTASAARSVRVIDDDLIGPEITQRGSIGTEFENEIQEFNWSVRDPSGIGSVNVSISKDNVEIHNSSESNSSFNFDAFGVGSYVMNVRTTDNDSDRSGDARTTMTSRSVIVRSDEEQFHPPVIEISGSEGSQNDDRLQEFTWMVIDEDNDLENVAVVVKRDGIDVHTSNSPDGTFNFDLLGIGIFVIEIKATDARGIETVEDREVLIVDDDIVGPVIQLSGSIGNENEELEQKFTWEINDESGISSVEVRITREGFDVHHSIEAIGEFNFDSLGPGSYWIGITAEDADNDYPGDGIQRATSRSVEVMPRIETTFQVSSVEPTASGFSVTFNHDVDFSEVNLYDETSDVTLLDETGKEIHGSIVLNPTEKTLDFVKTGGVLSAGNHSLLLKSGNDAFRDVLGELLDGNGDGIEGDDFNASFFVTAPNAPILAIPDFARGPGQAVNIPTVSAGLPVSIQGVEAANRFQFDILFNPEQLELNSARLGETVPPDWSISVIDFESGKIRVSAVGSSPLSKEGEIVVFDAFVPMNAAFGVSQLVHLENVIFEVDGAMIAGIGDQAIHQASFLGDVDGDGFFSGFDAAFIAQTVVGTRLGFGFAPLVDPVIIGNVTGSGELSGLDASWVAQKSVSILLPEIPDIPQSLFENANELSVAEDLLDDLVTEKWADAVDLVHV